MKATVRTRTGAGTGNGSLGRLVAALRRYRGNPWRLALLMSTLPEGIRFDQSACFLRKAGMSYLSTPLFWSASIVELRFLRITAGISSSAR